MNKQAGSLLPSITHKTDTQQARAKQLQTARSASAFANSNTKNDPIKQFPIWVQHLLEVLESWE